MNKIQLPTYNNGSAQAWQVGSMTVFTHDIGKKIREKHIELLNTESGITAKVGNTIVNIGEWVVLENDKLSVLSDQDFTQKYLPDFLE